MISEDEKIRAWIALYLGVRSGDLDLNSAQADYLEVELSRRAFPGKEASKIRTGMRRVRLAFAVLIRKAQTPDLSHAAIYRELAHHYGQSPSLVKQAHLEYQSFWDTRSEFDFTLGKPKKVPVTAEWLAKQKIPRIHFENYTEK